MSAIAIRNSIWEIRCNNKESRYLEIAQKYTKKELDIFAGLLGSLVCALDREPTDVLGQLYMELNLGNKRNGQFFTPMSICMLMAQLTIHDSIETIENEGFTHVLEPACGGGATIIGLALVLEGKGYNYQKCMVVSTVDIDITTVYMAYIQLSLLGIPARVAYGDTLSIKIFEE